MQVIHRSTSILLIHMKTTRFFFFLLTITAGLSIYGQSPSQNLFIEIDVSAEGDEIVRYGRIVYEEDLSPIRNYFEGIDSRNMFLDTLAQSLNELPIEKRNTLFYIHGMWAYKWSFLKGNHKKMQMDMWANNANPHGMIVTLIWHCKVNYFENREMALQSGKVLSPLIRQIHETTAAASSESTTNYLIHSMGHRVFQSIWEGHLNKDMTYQAEHIIMAGADIEPNSFEQGEILENIGYLSDNVLIYVHNNDRTLGMSKMLNKEDRLGMHGVLDLNKVSNSIVQIDVSVINDNEDPPSKFSNHRYFYMSPTIRKDVALFYQGVKLDKMPRRKKLNHARSWMLQMPQDN